MPAPNPPPDPTAHESSPSQAVGCVSPKAPMTEYAPFPSTPVARGTGTRHKLEGDPDRFDKYDREEYDEYVREDLSQRVFVDFEVFLNRALHVPEDWRKTWGPAIKTVKADKEFQKFHEAYCNLCNKVGGHEVAFYEPLMHMVNSILDVSTRSGFEGEITKKRQYYYVNNPGHPRGGVINKKGLSPDLVLLDEGRSPPCAGEPLHWANVLHVLEVKPHDNAIFDGRGVPRAIVGGVDPLVTHAKPPVKRRYRSPPAPAAASTQAGSKSAAQSTSKKQTGRGQSASKQQPASRQQAASRQQSALTRQLASDLQLKSKQQSTQTRQPTSNKRRASDSSAPNTRSGKKSKMGPPPSVPLKRASLQTASSSAKAQADSASRQTLEGSPDGQAKPDGEGTPSTKTEQESIAEIKQHIDPAIQVCRYLLEMFSVPLLRSHANASLVDRDRLQLYHANRSVILVSSAINFAKEESDGKDKFIACVLAFHRLSLEQNGIIGGQLSGLDNVKLVKGNKFERDTVMVQEGNVLHFDEGLNVVLEDVVSREPAIVGRSTVVLNARVEGGGPDVTPLAVKASWPTSGRVSEAKFLDKACEAAVDGYAWAANHLPGVVRTVDVTFVPGSTMDSVASLFDDPETVFGDRPGFVYERRVFRIILQERLVPLRYLPSAREIGQVFVDIACIHRWLYLCPGILHRDLSPNNIMCRYRIEEGKRKVYGVLMDFDLSSWRDALKGDYKMTSQQRTGTPPYMAQEILMGASRRHLYRHDLESLFYVMLLTATRHSIGIPEGWMERRLVMREEGGKKIESEKLPFHSWFDERNYHTLGSLKISFLVGDQSINLSPDFKDFRGWLVELRKRFAFGFAHAALTSRPRDQSEELPSWSTIQPAANGFEEETLGGYITYDAVIDGVPHFTGELKGLVVRDSFTEPTTANPRPAAPSV